MQTSLYEIQYKDGRIYRIFCANRKQNLDILRYLSSSQGLKEIKRKGAIVVKCGIHTMPQFKKIMEIK